MTGPDGKNDARVFRRLNRLRRLMDGPSSDFLIVSDNAYPLTKRLLILFSGIDTKAKCNDAINFIYRSSDCALK